MLFMLCWYCALIQVAITHTICVTIVVNESKRSTCENLVQRTCTSFDATPPLLVP